MGRGIVIGALGLGILTLTISILKFAIFLRHQLYTPEKDMFETLEDYRGIHEMFKREQNWTKEFMDENNFHFDSDKICLVITIEAGISALCSLLLIVGVCCRSRGFMIPYLGKSKQISDNYFFKLTIYLVCTHSL